MKNPSPWIIRSLVLLVVCAEPWPKFVEMAPSWTPRPTCAGFRPPTPWPGAAAARTIWLSVSSKIVELDLKPVVLTLAMLLPTTSIIVWCARRPVMPENRERSTGDTSGSGVGGGQGGPRDEAAGVAPRWGQRHPCRVVGAGASCARRVRGSGWAGLR